MRFFYMRDPFDEERFASATSTIGSFSGPTKDLRGDHTFADHFPRSGRRKHPLVIEWEPGSAEIAEFVWATTSLVMQERCCADLLERYSGAEAVAIEMVQDPKLKPPQRVTKRTKPRVWLPYEGPALTELWVTRWVPLDQERSTLTDRRTCSCGFEYWQPVGHEHFRTVEVATGRFEALRFPRDPHGGLRVRASDLGGDSIFRIEGPHENWLMVTEPVKATIEQEGWRNVDFFDMGEILAE